MKLLLIIICPFSLVLVGLFLIPIFDRFGDKLEEKVIDPVVEMGERVAEKIFKDGE